MEVYKFLGKETNEISDLYLRQLFQFLTISLLIYLVQRKTKENVLMACLSFLFIWKKDDKEEGISLLGEAMAKLRLGFSSSPFFKIL